MYLLHKLLCEDVSGELHVARDDVDQLARGEAQRGSMIIRVNQHRVKGRLHRTKCLKYLSTQCNCYYNVMYCTVHVHVESQLKFLHLSGLQDVNCID